MRLVVVDRDPSVAAAFAEVFAGEENVDIINADFREWWPRRNSGTAHRIISPGNSFGLMDGGFDEVLVNMFPGIDLAVKKEIRKKASGELLVGSAVIAEGPHFLKSAIVAYAPTMRLPMNISRTVNVYAAMWAALNAGLYIYHQTILSPALGTGYGHVSPSQSAKQMRLAWTRFQSGVVVEDWEHANRLEEELLATIER